MLFLLNIFIFAFLHFFSFSISVYDSKNVPPLAFSIIKNGEIIERKIIGYEDFDTAKKKKADKNTSIQINSMSKQFTVAAILSLEEKGLLSVNDPITKYIKHLPACFSKIKIINLITHTSGVSDYLDFYNLDEKFSKKEIITNSFVKNFVIKMGINKDRLKNFKYSYSNSGYVLLAEIVENVSNMKFDQFLKISFFDKLNMKNSFVMNENRDKNRKCISGHSAWPFFIKKDRDAVLYTSGDRGVCLSISDYEKWLMAIDKNILFDKKETAIKFTDILRVGDKLSSSTITPGKNFITYGYGWRHGILNDKYPAVFHGGKVRGYDSIAIKLLEKDAWIVILSASDIGEKTDLLYDIIEKYYNQM